MPQEAHLIQRPTRPAAQLILLFHGAGSDAPSMRALGQRLAAEFPQALVAAPRACQPCAAGFQWFPVLDLTEENQPARVAQAMPAFEASVAHWQRESGVDASATALIGFAQGATMALESLKLTSPLAARVFAISGRFASLPRAVPAGSTIHLLHGKLDASVPYRHTIEAAHLLRDLGADITAEVLPFIGHELHAEFIARVVEKLTSHIPQRLWAEALKAASPS